jgi:hypothetical protein
MTHYHIAPVVVTLHPNSCEYQFKSQVQIQPLQTNDAEVHLNLCSTKPWRDSKGNSLAHNINAKVQGNYLMNLSLVQIPQSLAIRMLY